MITLFSEPDDPDDSAQDASTAHMLSEFIREAAVLVAVFAPLDWIVQEHTNLTGWGVLGLFLFSGFLLYIGIKVENTRQ